MDVDLIIVGGGLAGNCLALSLQNTGLKIAIIEAQSRQTIDGGALGDRALALAAGTVDALGSLDLWEGISHAATPIENIHVSDQGHFGKTHLSAKKENVPALGYVIAARDLENHIANHVAKLQNTTVFYSTRVAGIISDENAVFVSLKLEQESINLRAKLVVGADGGNSSVRQLLNITQHRTDYGQSAIVTTISTSRPHQNVAYERFTSSGPLALLPLGTHHCAVVWTRKSDDAQALMQGSEADFIAQLQQCFGYRLGELNLSAPRHAFPLSLIRADDIIANRAVIIGNAAHQLHPVAGQGFNLGLRDVTALATMIATQSDNDFGAADFLASYAKKRESDQSRTIQFTDTLVHIFSNEWGALTAARNLGLTLLDTLPFAKSILAKHAMGLHL